MKAAVIFTFVITLFFTSCSKNNNSIPLSSSIIGTWNWTATCGGLTGECGYPNKDNHKIITFTDSLFTGKIFAKSFVNASYSLINQSNQDSYTSYQILINNDISIDANIANNRLSINTGDISESYERLK